jgi:transcription initiation factor TFIID subunit 6
LALLFAFTFHNYGSGDHLNMALKKYSLEPIYGVVPGKRIGAEGGSADKDIDLEQFGARPSVPIPLKVGLSLHWLAIQGVQPSIQENPVFASADADSLAGLNKEYQNLYTRLIGVLTSGDPGQIKGAMKVLAGDRCLPPLLPPLCRHLYTTARSSSSSLDVLQVVLATIGALTSNKHLSSALVPFLGQLLGAVLAILLSPGFPGHLHLVQGEAEKAEGVRSFAAKTLGQLMVRFSV